MRLIDADALIEKLKEERKRGFPDNENLYLYAVSAIIHAPEADPPFIEEGAEEAEERKHGHWIYEEKTILRYTYTTVLCPFCSGLDSFYADYNEEKARKIHTQLNHRYCHYCGAQMDEKDESDGH